MPRLLLFPPLLVACALEPLAEPPGELPPETDLPPTWEGRWDLACEAALELERGGRLTLHTASGERELAHEVVGLPAFDAAGRRLAFAHAPVARPETVISALACEDGAWGEPEVRVDGPGSPDRLAISADGENLAWVSGASGLPAIWTAPWADGPPVQRSNVGVQRPPGGPPPGFLAPPHDPPRFEGPDLAWQTPEGPVRLRLSEPGP